MSSENTKSLKNQKYRGVIIEGLDPTLQGRYKVFCFDLHHHASPDPKKDFIWCKNRVHSYRLGFNLTNYGNYSPIHPSQNVYIKFESNDMNSGYICELIDDIISTTVKNTLPFGLTLNDRDQITVLAKTLKYNHTFFLNEDSSKAPNSVQLYYNNKFVKIVLNNDGLHIFSGANLNITVNGSTNIQCSGNINLESESNINIKASGSIFLDAPVITSSDISSNGTHYAESHVIGSGGNAEDNDGYDTNSPEEL